MQWPCALPATAEALWPTCAAHISPANPSHASLQEIVDLYGFLMRNRIIFLNQRISDQVATQASRLSQSPFFLQQLAWMVAAAGLPSVSAAAVGSCSSAHTCMCC